MGGKRRRIRDPQMRGRKSNMSQNRTEPHSKNTGQHIITYDNSNNNHIEEAKSHVDYMVVANERVALSVVVVVAVVD